MHEQWRCKCTQDEDKENTSRMKIITLGSSKEGKQIPSDMSTKEDQIADNFTKPLPKASFTRDQEIYWGDIT